MALMIAVLLMLLGSADAAPEAAVAPAAAHPLTPANPFAEPTRGLLAQHCGRCHLPNLPTSVPRALAIFNLAEDPWYGRLTTEQYGALSGRLSGMGSLPDADKAIVESFIRCARDGECTPARP
jgi:hypothetical protein